MSVRTAHDCMTAVGIFGGLQAASNPNDPGSIAVSIGGATDLDITLVESEVRKVLTALHGTKDEANSGRASDTPDTPDKGGVRS